MKNTLGMLAMMAAISNQGMVDDFMDLQEIPKTKEPIKKIIPKGLKPFSYGKERIVHALNQKNADRKAEKLGYI